MVKKVYKELDVEEIKLALQDVVNKMITENEKKYEEERKRREAEEKLRYQKYRESLKPVSKEEFKARFENVRQRYVKYLKTCLKENILFCSLDLDLKGVLLKCKNAKDDIDLAEIIDDAEKTMNDLETVIHTVKSLAADTKIEEELQKIKKIKER